MLQQRCLCFAGVLVLCFDLQVCLRCRCAAARAHLQVRCSMLCFDRFFQVCVALVLVFARSLVLQVCLCRDLCFDRSLGVLLMCLCCSTGACVWQVPWPMWTFAGTCACAAAEVFVF